MISNRQKKQYTLSELTQGLDVTIKGDPNCLISGVTTIQQGKHGTLSFLMNPLYKKYLATTEASAVILAPTLAENCPTNAIISRDPYYTYAKIATFFEQRPVQPIGIHPTVVVGQDCIIDPTASIGPHCVIGNGVKIAAHVVIGPNCSIGDETEIDEQTRLDAGVNIYHQVKIGKRAQLFSGVVVGSDGFGIAKHGGVWHKVPQLGRVIIGDDVDLGANTTIDRGAIEDTVIERDVKIDNLVQVGHNVRIGEHTAIAGCVGIAGSATIGKNCLIGGAAGIGGHISLADNVMIVGMSGITKTIREPGMYAAGVAGIQEITEWKKASARYHRLEQLMERVATLESLIAELTERNAT